MLSNNQIVEKTVVNLGMKYDKKQHMGCGEYGGYTMLIVSSPANSRENTVSLLLCASKNGQGADRELIAAKGIPSGVEYIAEEVLHCFKVQVTFKSEQVVDTLTELAKNAVSVLSSEGYVNCNMKGEEGKTDVYIVKGKVMFLAPYDADDIRSELNIAKGEYDEIAENCIMGIVGAVIGSIVGAGVILLCGRLGFISMLGGIALGAAIVWLYKKLGHKLSNAGAVFCTVLAAVMSFLAFRVDCALDLYTAFKETEFADDVTFFGCFVHARELFELADSLFSYYSNMVLILISGAGAAGAMIWGDRLNTKQGFGMIKLGDEI